MKKSAIALAVAGLIAAPLAMADVQISGQLQTQLVNYSKNDFGAKGLYQTDGGMGSNLNTGGNWGALAFSASEDLGDGLKALARYSFNVSTQDGDGKNIGTRDAYVGLAGDWGAVLGGKMSHPYKTSTLGWDPFVATFMQARDNGGMGSGLYGAEVNNAFAYAGKFGGVKVVAAVIVDESINMAGDKTNGKHPYTFSVNAPIGPVELAVAHINVKHPVLKDRDATKIGVKWAAGDFTLAGQVERLNKGLTDSGNSGNVMYLTGSYAMGNNTISASYGSEDKDVTGTGDRGQYFAIGGNHAFSKNTSAFVGYRSTEYKFAGSKARENAFGAGLRVKF
ncbi:MAG: porin [Thiohalomonadaceae bacterium]